MKLTKTPTVHLPWAPATTLLIALTSTLAYGQDQLPTEPERIEQVTITATRLPRTIDDIAGTVTLIPAERLEREMANDLDDVVRFQPGVTMDSATRGGNQGFSIRGIGGNRVLTVIDGVRSSDIYAAGPASYGKDSFEIDNLKAVEIIRGPASVLYGADAMGGAVILTSKTARDLVGSDRGSYVGFRTSAASADEQYKAGVTAAWQSDDFGLLLQMTGREFAESEVQGNGALNPQEGDAQNLLLQGFWELSDTQSLRLNAETYHEEILVDIQSELSSTVYSSLGRDETRRNKLGVQYDWQLHSALVDELQLLANVQQTDGLQFTRQERVSYSFINPGNPASFGGTEAIRRTDFEFNQTTAALNLNLRKSLTTGVLHHALAYGFNIDETATERPRNRCEEAVATGQSTCAIAAFPFASPEVFPNKTFPDSTTTRHGFYVQNEITVAGTGLTLVPGLRYDRYELEPDSDTLLDGVGDIENFGGFSVSAVEDSQLSLSLGAIYDFDSVYSVFAQYAEGYRPPNFDESNQAFVNLGFGYATVPNPALQAESSRGYELGLRASFSQAYLSLAVYHNTYEDFIESNFVGMEGSVSLFQDQNLGTVEIRGLEAMANWYLAPQWQLRGSLAYSRGEDKTSNVPIDSIEPLTGVLGLAFDEESGRWGGEFLMTAVADKDRVSSTSQVTASNYTVVDLVGYLRFGQRATVRAGVFNVFDEQYARWGNIQGLEASATQTIANAQQPGINFRAGVNVEF